MPMPFQFLQRLGGRIQPARRNAHHPIALAHFGAHQLGRFARFAHAGRAFDQHEAIYVELRTEFLLDVAPFRARLVGTE